MLDFLTDRKCLVEVDGTRSSLRAVPLGCVQGSVLGPKLFNLYTSKIPLILPDYATMTSYADDSYVIITGNDIQDLKSKTEECMTMHINELLRLVMVVNTKKTELVVFNKKPLESIMLNCLGEVLESKKLMKVLGVIFEETLSWQPHIDKTVKKMNSITHGLKFLWKRLTKDQFIKATTSQYYGMLYYGSQVWLGDHTPKGSLKRHTSLHYRLLRIAVNDWKQCISRSSLDKIGRAKPSVWAKYSVSSIVIKIMTTEQPKHLFDSLKENSYHERRHPNRLKNFSTALTRIGDNSLQNRLTLLFKETNFDHFPHLTPEYHAASVQEFILC